jgi:hypothetical protein
MNSTTASADVVRLSHAGEPLRQTNAFRSEGTLTSTWKRDTPVLGVNVWPGLNRSGNEFGWPLPVVAGRAPTVQDYCEKSPAIASREPTNMRPCLRPVCENSLSGAESSAIRSNVL